MSRLLRLISRTPSGPAKARHRSPSSFRSNTHPGDENRSLVKVASCGSTQDGSAPAISNRKRHPPGPRIKIRIVPNGRGWLRPAARCASNHELPG
jgi:hypothetical protein